MVSQPDRLAHMRFYYIKLWYETLDDPKMGRLSDHLYRRAIELFLLAGMQGGDGLLPSVEDIAYRLRADVKSILADLGELEKVNIVSKHKQGWFVTHFAERQAAASDADRAKAYRERQEKTVTKRDKNVTESSRSRRQLIKELNKEIKETKDHTVTKRDENVTQPDEQKAPEPTKEESNWQYFVNTLGMPRGAMLKYLMPCRLKPANGDGRLHITHPDPEAIPWLQDRVKAAASRIMMADVIFEVEK